MTTTPSESWLVPAWPAPDNVRACVTTRLGGVSQPPYDSLNLADHVGDDPEAVAGNRRLLQAWLALPEEPRWLKQVHGTAVPAADAIRSDCCEADASFTQAAGTVCAVMTADCLPVLLCDREGTTVAAAHAGWRGLQAGILEQTVSQLAIPGEQLLAWLGPAIGPDAFEVGPEVREGFCAIEARAEQAFRPGEGDRWFADIYQLARQRLQRCGVTAVYGGEFCTYHDARRFYSYRRDGVTGRMASLIWLSGN